MKYNIWKRKKNNENDMSSLVVVYVMVFRWPGEPPPRSTRPILDLSSNKLRIMTTLKSIIKSKNSNRMINNMRIGLTWITPTVIMREMFTIDQKLTRSKLCSIRLRSMISYALKRFWMRWAFSRLSTTFENVF